MVSTTDNLNPPVPDLTDRDRQWLTAYLDCGEDVRVLAGRTGASILEVAAWLTTTPIRRALAAWDYAQRRARTVREEADRRIAIDALKAVCQRLSHRPAPPGDSLAAPSASTQPVGAETPPSDFAALVELRRAATTIIRSLSAGPAAPIHRRANPIRHRPRPSGAMATASSGHRTPPRDAASKGSSGNGPVPSARRSHPEAGPSAPVPSLAADTIAVALEILHAIETGTPQAPDVDDAMIRAVMDLAPFIRPAAPPAPSGRASTVPVGTGPADDSG